MQRPSGRACVFSCRFSAKGIMARANALSKCRFLRETAEFSHGEDEPNGQD